MEIIYKFSEYKIGRQIEVELSNANLTCESLHVSLGDNDLL